MKVLKFFLWILVPLALWQAITIWGMPHFVVSYRFHDSGARWDPHVPRVYIDCTYLGWTGARTVPAIDGRCPWIRVFLAEDG